MTNVNIFTIIGRLTADAEEFTSVLSRAGRNICGQIAHQKALGEVATDICLNRCGTQIRIVLFLSVLIIGAGFKAASGQHWCALDEFCTQIVTDKLLRSANRDKRSLLILSTVYRNTKPNVCVVANSDIANLTVASNRSYQKDGQWVDVPSFVAVAASGKLAEFIASHFHKGDPIMVAGTLSSYSHKNKDGENRTFYTVWADKASFASRGKDTTQNSTPAPAATPASAPAPSAPTYGEYGADEFDAVEEDDLPF